jgi:hypothetical protein
MKPNHNFGIDTLILAVFVAVIGRVIISTFPREEFKKREYGWVTLWTICCAGGIGLAAAIFSQIINYVGSS